MDPLSPQRIEIFLPDLLNVNQRTLSRKKAMCCRALSGVGSSSCSIGKVALIENLLSGVGTFFRKM